MSKPAPHYLKKSKRWLFWLILAAFLGGSVYAGYRIIDRWMEYRREGEHYAAMQAFVSMEPATTPTAPVEEPEEILEPTAPIESRYTFPTVDFVSLFEVNEEILGWIYLEGTTVNYPFAQHSDNYYYLNRMFNRMDNGSGSIFMDCGNRADFGDDNTILYGHNMRNNTMFSALTQYKEPGFFEEHPVILLMTPVQNFAIKIFAAESAPKTSDCWLINFDTPESRQNWIDGRIAASVINTGIQPGTEDHIVTLSTCISDRNGDRFLVYGVLEA